MKKRRRPTLDLGCKIEKKNRPPLPELQSPLNSSPHWGVEKYSPLLLSLTDAPKPVVFSEDLIYNANSSLHGIDSNLSMWNPETMVFEMTITRNVNPQASQFLRECNIVGSMIRRLNYVHERLKELGESPTHHSLSKIIAFELYKVLRLSEQPRTPLQIIRTARCMRKKLATLSRVIGCGDLSKPAILSRLPSSATLLNRAYSLNSFRDQTLINELVQTWTVDLDKCLTGLTSSPDFMILFGQLIKSNTPSFIPLAVAEAFAEAARCVRYLRDYTYMKATTTGLLSVQVEPFEIYKPGMLLFDTHESAVVTPIISLLLPFVRKCKSIRSQLWRTFGPEVRASARIICSEGLLQNGRLLTALVDGSVAVRKLEISPLVDASIMKTCEFVKSWWLNQSPPSTFHDRISFNKRMQQAAGVIDTRCVQLLKDLDGENLSVDDCTQAFSPLLSIPTELDSLQ